MLRIDIIRGGCHIDKFRDQLIREIKIVLSEATTILKPIIIITRIAASMVYPPPWS